MSEKLMRPEFEVIIVRIKERIVIQQEKLDRGWNNRVCAEDEIKYSKRDLHTAELNERAAQKLIAEAETELFALSQELDVMQRAMKSVCVGE